MNENKAMTIFVIAINGEECEWKQGNDDFVIAIKLL